MLEQSQEMTAASGTTRWSLLALIRQAPDLAALVLIALVGLGIAGYLTTVHYAHVSLVCTAGGVVNCTAVTTSAYSVVPGTQVPITVPGMLWFLVSGGLAIAAWRMQARTGVVAARLTLAQLAWGAVGLVTVLYLVYVEIVRLHAICEWCSAVHVLTVLTFLVTLYRVQQLPA
ncbi:MAG TPA: vitamin K epoxide reductase family protein [Chloroflexota bacterium]|nr:vitamin K epoxide reductase family protein [Chloroflexota bacterium]